MPIGTKKPLIDYPVTVLLTKSILSLGSMSVKAPSGLTVEDGAVGQLRSQWKLDELVTYLSKGRVQTIL
jgi:hypothetical protein